MFLFILALHGKHHLIMIQTIYVSVTCGCSVCKSRARAFHYIADGHFETLSTFRTCHSAAHCV